MCMMCVVTGIETRLWHYIQILGTSLIQRKLVFVDISLFHTNISYVLWIIEKPLLLLPSENPEANMYERIRRIFEKGNLHAHNSKDL